MPRSIRLTLRELLLDRARADPDKVGFVFGDQELTFGELAERAARRGGALHRMGVRQGDRIALTMSVGLPAVEVFWALQLIGAAPCVLNPGLPGPTLDKRVELIRPRLAVSDELAASMATEGTRFAEAELSVDDLAFLQLTSGTSGTPRASMILHRNVLAYLQSNPTDRFLDSDDVLVGWVPPWHDLGLVRFVLGPVYQGACCHLIEPAVRTIPAWLNAISDARGTYTAAPDFAFRLAIRMVKPGSADLSSLRLAKIGAEPVRWSTIEQFESRFGVSGRVVPGYGLGEVTLGVTEHLPGDEIPVDERGNVSNGPANEGVELRAGLSLEEPGEICVRGDGVFAGYFDAPAETERVLRDGWLHTGDSGYLDDEGRLFVLGRRQGMIKRAGAVIAPRELEEAAERVAGVRIAAATSLPATDRDADVIVVAVEAEEPAQAGDPLAAEVSRAIVEAVGFAPGRVAVLPRRTIPRTENGKVRHGRLRELLEDGV